MPSIRSCIEQSIEGEPFIRTSSATFRWPNTSRQRLSSAHVFSRRADSTTAAAGLRPHTRNLQEYFSENAATHLEMATQKVNVATKADPALDEVDFDSESDEETWNDVDGVSLRADILYNLYESWSS